MGEAKRRKLLDPTFGKSAIPEIPQEWTLVGTFLAEDELAVMAVQGSFEFCDRAWNDLTSTPVDQSELDNTGILIHHSDRACMIQLMQPALAEIGILFQVSETRKLARDVVVGVLDVGIAESSRLEAIDVMKQLLEPEDEFTLTSDRAGSPQLQEGRVSDRTSPG